MRKFFFFFGILILVSACIKEKMELIESDINPEISEIPEIKLLSQSATDVTAYQDSIVFTIQYTDGDGDLGSTDPDKMNIELIDQRDPDLLVFGYHLSPRAPDDSGISIQGELEIILDNTILLDMDNSSETTSFKIRIQDEAGNWSNEIESAEVTIAG